VQRDRESDQPPSRDPFAVLDSTLESVVALEAVRAPSGQIVDFRIVYANPAAVDLSGRRMDALVGELWCERYPGAVQAGLFEAYVRVVETGEPIYVPAQERAEMSDDGITTAWYRLRASKFGDSVIVAYRDVTADRQHAAELARERAEVQLLQEAFLPTELPAAKSLTAAAAYLPASNAPMGGDWYDAFLVDHRMFLVLGDVAGHGVRSAAVMGQLRNAARAYAIEDPAPSQVLARLNRMLCRLEPGHTATAIVGVWNGETRTFTLSSAGHPPVLRCRVGEFGYLEPTRRGIMLGVTLDAEYEEDIKVMRPGTTLLFYTDGLIESPDRSLDHGMADLKSFVETLADLSPQALCDAVLAWRTARHRRDDLCVLAGALT